MAVSKLDAVLEALPKLTAAELAAVRQRAQLLTGTRREATTATEQDDWLWTGILLELRRRGLISGAGRVSPATLSKEYSERAVGVREHLLKGVSKPLSTAERVALGQLAGCLLVEHLTVMRVPVGPKTVATNIDKIPTALEEAFPGYWSAKQLGLCLFRL